MSVVFPKGKLEVSVSGGWECCCGREREREKERMDGDPANRLGRVGGSFAKRREKGAVAKGGRRIRHAPTLKIKPKPLKKTGALEFGTGEGTPCCIRRTLFPEAALSHKKAVCDWPGGGDQDLNSWD